MKATSQEDAELLAVELKVTVLSLPGEAGVGVGISVILFQP